MSAEAEPAVGVAIVTGAASGIGRACAERLADEFTVVLVDRDREAVERVADGLRAVGRTVLPHELDVTDLDGQEALFDHLRSEGHRLRVLVSAVSLEIHGGLFEIDEAGLRASFEATVVSAFRLMRNSIDMMRASGSGRIVVINSLHATEPFLDALAYNVVEAGLRQLSLSVAHEVVSSGIAINLIVPGWVDTPGERRWLSGEEIARVGTRLPLKRPASAEEIADAAFFLASSSARYITGTELRVDGGMGLTMASLPFLDAT